MINQATSELLRDSFLHAVSRIQGADWRSLLDTLNAHAIQAHGASKLLDEHADQVFQAVHDRRTRMAASAALHRAKKRAGGAKSCVTPVGAFAYDRLAGLGASRLNIEPEMVRSDESAAGPVWTATSASRGRRPRMTHAERAQAQATTRRRYYNGHRLPWPATVKQDFHPAELSAIGIIFREIREHGACELALGTIAARAKCCRRTVQTAIRWASHRGYLLIEERVKGTHLIRIASDAIRDWLVESRPLKLKISQQKEDLNDPAKVATDYHSPLDQIPENPGSGAMHEPTSSVLQSCPEASGSTPNLNVGKPADGSCRPSRLDETIALWRTKIITEKIRRVATEGHAFCFGPSPIIRPG